MSEHAQYQSSETSSPNNLMSLMMDILSCQSRKSPGENNDINDGCFNLGELVPELWYCARSLSGLACCNTSRNEALVGHTCIGPQDVCSETHLYVQKNTNLLFMKEKGQLYEKEAHRAPAISAVF